MQERRNGSCRASIVDAAADDAGMKAAMFNQARKEERRGEGRRALSWRRWNEREKERESGVSSI